MGNPMDEGGRDVETAAPLPVPAPVPAPATPPAVLDYGRPDKESLSRTGEAVRGAVAGVLGVFLLAPVGPGAVVIAEELMRAGPVDAGRLGAAAATVVLGLTGAGLSALTAFQYLSGRNRRATGFGSGRVRGTRFRR
jgi:hypothetical protein